MGYRFQEEPASLIFNSHLNPRWLEMEEPDVAMQNAGVCIRYLSHKGVKTSPTCLFIVVMKNAQFFLSGDSVSLKNIKDGTDWLASWSQQATKKPPVPTPSLHEEWLGHNGAKHCCPSHTFWNLPPPTKKSLKTPSSATYYNWLCTVIKCITKMPSWKTNILLITKGFYFFLQIHRHPLTYIMFTILCTRIEFFCRRQCKLSA